MQLIKGDFHSSINSTCCMTWANLAGLTSCTGPALTTHALELHLIISFRLWRITTITDSGGFADESICRHRTDLWSYFRRFKHPLPNNVESILHGSGENSTHKTALHPACSSKIVCVAAMHELPPSSNRRWKIERNVLFFRDLICFLFGFSFMLRSGLWTASHGRLHLFLQSGDGFPHNEHFKVALNGFVIFLISAPRTRTITREKAGVTIKLCFNSRRFLHSKPHFFLGRCDLCEGWVKPAFLFYEMLIQFFRDGFVCSIN